MQIRKAQTFIEYLLVISAVTIIMISMSTLLRRSVQGMVKAVADQIGNQVNADQQDGARGGRIDNLQVTMRRDQERNVREYLGNITYSYDGAFTDTRSDMLVNAGYREDK